MIGFITGLASEADCLAGLVDHAAIRIAGLGAGNAERCARDLIESRHAPLISFGLAGGLVPGLKPGSVVIAETIVTPGGLAYTTDAAFGARLLAALPNAIRRPIAGSDTILESPAEKADLHRRTRAVAVDMESHQIAKIAHEAGIGFMAIRAIADPYDATLPKAALDAVGADGTPDIIRVIARLAMRPWELGALLKLGMYSREAHESLRRVAPVLIGSGGHL